MTLHWLQLQVGHSGNPLLLEYNVWKDIASDSWIKALWESIHIFPVHLCTTYDDIPVPRQHDCTLMSILQPLTRDRTELARVKNRCRCYLNSLFLSDITTADGRQLNDDFITGSRVPIQSKMKFPREEPSQLDWKCWQTIWQLATLPGWKLKVPLGQWLHKSHMEWRWFWDDTSHSILEKTERGIRKQTTPDDGYRTRSNHIFLPSPSAVTVMPSCATPISVTPCATLLHEHAIKALGQPGPPLPTLTQPTLDIWDTLLSWGGSWMWSNLHFDNGGKDLGWLVTALQNGTALWVTDGSYDIHRSPMISGTGWIVLDTSSNRHFACSFAEYSHLAGSYRAELLGLLSIHVFLRALELTSGCKFTRSTTIACDNLKALNNASELRRRIPIWMKCPDILRTLRSTRQHITTKCKYRHVPAHMDDILQWHQLTTVQQLNVQCDLLAKAAVARARNLLHLGLAPTTHMLPCESATVYVNDIKLTSDPTNALRHHIGRHQAKLFHIQELGWDTEKFEGVCWDSLQHALSTKSGRFALWLTKQTSNFSASRKQLARYTGSDDDRCPSCIIHKEDANHLCICPNEDRTLLLKQDTETLGSWLYENDNTHPEIAYWVPKYILCRGTIKFADLGRMSPEMQHAAEAQDLIGWRNFMEGRITTEFGKMQQLHLLSSESRLTTSTWSTALVSKLLHITHTQWILRNFMLHNTLHGYLSMNNQMDLLREVEVLLETSDDQVPEDRRFLLELDLADIADLDYNSQTYWVQAVNAARHAQHPSDSTTASSCATSRTNHATRQPWTSKWGIAQVLDQIRQDSHAAQANHTPWWGLHSRQLLELLPPQAHETPNNPRRNASYKRRKPD